MTRTRRGITVMLLLLSAAPALAQTAAPLPATVTLDQVLTIMNDHLTARAYFVAETLTLADIALVAFDDFEWSDLFRPRLTVIAQPTREIGAEAVRLLLSRLADPDLPARSIRLIWFSQ